MKWNKLGLIFKPDRHYDWMQSHASLPLPIYIGDDIFRIYFASRDIYNRSQVGYIEVAIDNPNKILKMTERPVLNVGSLGCFDDHGVYAASIVRHDSQTYMYYLGWNPGKEGALFYSSIGLAVSEDGGRTFRKYSKAPIMARSEYDPCLVAAPFIIKEKELWRMWYGSGIKWEIIDGKMQSFYHIKYAESKNGINWERTGTVCIDFSSKDETNIGHPRVFKESGLYKMLYSYIRGNMGYRIGYAESEDGIKWLRKDEEVGIDVSLSGWDSKSIEHPYVFSHNNKKYLLYCGNNFGRDGFGLAVASGL